MILLHTVLYYTTLHCTFCHFRYGMATSSTCVTYLQSGRGGYPIHFSFVRGDGHLLHLSPILKYRKWLSLSTSVLGEWMATSSTHCIPLRHTVFYGILQYCSVCYYTIPYYKLLYYAALDYTILYSSILYCIVHFVCYRWSGHLLHMCHLSVKLREWPAPYTSFLRGDGHLLHLSHISKYREWLSPFTSLFGERMATSSTHCSALHYTVFYCVQLYR